MARRRIRRGGVPGHGARGPGAGRRARRGAGHGRLPLPRHARRSIRTRGPRPWSATRRRRPSWPRPPPPTRRCAPTGRRPPSTPPPWRWPSRSAASSARPRPPSGWPSPDGESDRRCSRRSRCSAPTAPWPAWRAAADRLAAGAPPRRHDPPAVRRRPGPLIPVDAGLPLLATPHAPAPPPDAEVVPHRRGRLPRGHRVAGVADGPAVLAAGGRGDRGDGGGPVQRGAVPGPAGPARPGRATVAPALLVDDHGHRLQGAGRHLHRGRGGGPLPRVGRDPVRRHPAGRWARLVGEPGRGLPAAHRPRGHGGARSSPTSSTRPAAWPSPRRSA